MTKPDPRCQFWRALHLALLPCVPRKHLAAPKFLHLYRRFQMLVTRKITRPRSRRNLLLPLLQPRLHTVRHLHALARGASNRPVAEAGPLVLKSSGGKHGKPTTIQTLIWTILRLAARVMPCQAHPHCRLRRP